MVCLEVSGLQREPRAVALEDRFSAQRPQSSSAPLCFLNPPGRPSPANTILDRTSDSSWEMGCGVGTGQACISGSQHLEGSSLSLSFPQTESKLTVTFYIGVARIEMIIQDLGDDHACAQCSWVFTLVLCKFLPLALPFRLRSYVHYWPVVGAPWLAGKWVTQRPGQGL